jgi:hypothetical protein
MWEHCSLRISRVELIELMLEVISLMSSLFWWLLAIKELSSWVLVVAIWKKGADNWYRGNKRGLGCWVGPLRRRVSNDRYHCDQGEKGDPMGYEPNKGIKEGLGPQKHLW